LDHNNDVTETGETIVFIIIIIPFFTVKNIAPGNKLIALGPTGLSILFGNLPHGTDCRQHAGYGTVVSVILQCLFIVTLNILQHTLIKVHVNFYGPCLLHPNPPPPPLSYFTMNQRPVPCQC